MNTVRLLVNGLEFGGWKQVEITAGLDRMARDFKLEVTDRWPGSDVPRRIAPGDVCTLTIGDDQVLFGYVDGTPISYDGRQVSVAVVGRSRTADLVDCAAIHATGQIKGQTVERIARMLAEPYGVPVVAAVDTGAVVADHQIDQGETVAESIDRLLELRQLLATDDEAGRLVLTRAGRSAATTALVVGENVLTGEADLSLKDRFSEYRVKGQRSGSDADFGDAVAGQIGTATDPGVPRRRVRVDTMTGQPDVSACRDQARWQATHRAAGTYRATYTVQGWRQADGVLWQPNMLVRVQDPVIGWDMDMLIGEVTYELSDTGMRTTLSVAPPEAWALEPKIPKKGAGESQSAFAGEYGVPYEAKPR